MANLTRVLQEEIRRLAQGDTAQTGAAKQAAARHRREIASLKKALQELRRKLSVLLSQAGRRAAATSMLDAEVKGIRFSPRSVRTHRKRLKLSAAEYAQLVGVSMQTIYHWEQGKSRPRRSQMATLQTVRAMGRREQSSGCKSSKAHG